MSGICGVIRLDGAPVKPEILKEMAKAAAHRGPDGIRYWTDDNAALAHLAQGLGGDIEGEVGEGSVVVCPVADAIGTAVSGGFCHLLEDLGLHGSPIEADHSADAAHREPATLRDVIIYSAIHRCW